MADEKDITTVASNNQGSDVEPGQVDSLGDEDYGWNRGLSPRAVIMLSLGGGIGLGLWIGTGSALSSGECYIHDYNGGL